MRKIKEKIEKKPEILIIEKDVRINKDIILEKGDKIKVVAEDFNNSQSMTVIAYSRTYEYDIEEIEEMLDDMDMYKNADNLPKWIYYIGLNKPSVYNEMFGSYMKNFYSSIPALLEHFIDLIKQGKKLTLSVKEDDEFFTIE